MKKEFNNKIKTFVVCMIIILCNLQSFAQHLPPNYPSGTQVNFVRTWDAVAPEQDPNTLMTRPLKDVKQTTQYIDGLGRPLQTVVKEGSMATNIPATDMVSPIEYDEFGREQFKYLSFGANTTGGYPTNDGKFKKNPFEQQAAFYNSSNTASPLYNQGEIYLYSKTNFEASPLNRVNDVYAPGNSWVGSETNAEAQRRNVQIKYYINTITDAVHIWTVTDNNPIGQFETYGTNATYPAGELYKNVTINEHKKQVIEFINKEGKIILKKVQLTAIADDGTGSGHLDWLCTYYIYDDFNNLRCVIQPQAVKLMNDAGNWDLTPYLDEQCFRYEYDARNRMIMKKVPGAGEAYMVYDNRDRIVMTQDANMRQGTVKWMVSKYDELNRLTETGLWTNNLSCSTHLSLANGISNYPSTTSGYEQLTLTHYDDYIGLPGSLSASYLNTWNVNFSNTDNNNWPYPQMPAQSNTVKDMTTWNQIKVLGTSNTYLYTVNIYDDKGRLIQVQSTNITGGIDVTTTQYNWAGEPLVNVQKQDKQGANSQTHIIITKVKYDDLGRILNIKKLVNSTINGVVVVKPELEIVNNQYDKLGQLVLKNIGKKKIPGTENYTNDPIETLNYDYNIRGWLLGMNRGYLTQTGQGGTNKFGFELGYDKLTGSSGRNFTAAQYNGNINGVVWKSDGDDVKRKYDFVYDPVNRLLKGQFEQDDATAAWNNTTMNYSVQMGDGSNPLTAYDDNGNILKMQQSAWKLTNNDLIDDLDYTYQPGSNKLKQVIDGKNESMSKLGDFKYDASTKTSTDYTYDVNGNLVTDQNKKIQSILYNHLNLPSIIKVNNGDIDRGGNPVNDIITYTYDATGIKLEKTVDDAIGDFFVRKKTTYINGVVYQDDTLQFIPQEEGRIRFKPAILNSSGAEIKAAGFEYDYMLKDHLGNVRMVLTEEQKQDRYPAATLENDTYNGGTAISVENQFYSIDETKIVLQSVATNIPAYKNKNAGQNNNPYSNTDEYSKRLYLLNATTNSVQNKTGLGIVLKVMAGDAINIFGKSYHKKPVSDYTSPTIPLSVLDLMDLLAASPVASSKGITGTQISGLPNFPTNVTDLLNNQPPQTTNRPRASINWVILDEQFKYVSGGFDMVETATNTSGTFKDHTINGIPILKNGYIYVYCSNESQYDVFFDNLQVIHDRGPILEETHYYPFGLTMDGISSKAASGLVNKYKFNSSTEFQNKEFGNGTGLDIYATEFRGYDPQIGRFIQIDPLSVLNQSSSPYSFADNNPILFVDPLGLDTIRSATQPTTINEGDVWVKTGENGSTFYYNYDPTNPDAAQGGNLEGYVSNGEGPKTLNELILEPNKTNNSTPASTPAGVATTTQISSGIVFSNSANRGVVSNHSLHLLSDIMRESGNNNVIITSTLRTPESQASAMYSNILSRGAQYNLRLYGSNGDRVVNVATNGRRNGLSRDEILRNMAIEIRRIGPGRVSRHCGDPNVINVLDISPRTITNRQAFVREIRERGIFLLQPPADPAYHLEIRQ